jgi:hydroxysqualene synthase
VSLGHYENFPVASILCPPALRAPIRAIYAFARTADDIADEGDTPPEQRRAELARYREALHRAARGQAARPDQWPQVFAPMALQMLRHRLPLHWLEALLDAFAQDTHNPVYATRGDLLGYCARSANPIGRLLLHLIGIGDAQSLRQSDCICTALQLINFWQDLNQDLARGRIYVPAADAKAHGLDLHRLPAWGDSPHWQELVRGLVQWAADTLARGADLPLRIPGRFGWELRLVVQGGWRILEKISQGNCASFAPGSRPRLSAGDVPLMTWRALNMPRAALRAKRAA